jgi:hypothetical protein
MMTQSSVIGLKRISDMLVGSGDPAPNEAEAELLWQKKGEGS